MFVRKHYQKVASLAAAGHSDLWSDQFPCWSSVPSIHSPLNTAGTPLELALPAAALWWALSPCMSANIHTHTPAPAIPNPLSKTILPNFPLQLCCYNFIKINVPAVDAILIFYLIAWNECSCVVTVEESLKMFSSGGLCLERLLLEEYLR